MYNYHYDFKKKPFELTPDPEFIWLSEELIETISRFKLAIQKNEGLMVLTGDVGTGKTTFTNYLIQELENEFITAIIPYPDLDDHSFFNFLSSELGMNKEINSRGAFLFNLDIFLHEASIRNTGVLIIFDDSQNMSKQLAQEVRFLAGLKKNGKNLIRIFLVAQSKENEDYLDKLNMDIEQTVAFSHHLKALTKSETQRYISYRLKMAGAAKNPIKPDAIDKIYAYSAGYQRMINIICDNALLAGYSEGLHEIKKSTVSKCIAELRPGACKV